MTSENIFETFDEKNNLVKEYGHWKLLVSNRSKTLGNCVLITKQHHARFSELSQEEMVDFYKVVREVESALKKAFNFDEINWLMLMMKDHHTHFHIIPRYKEARNFAGIEWIDVGWPTLPKSQHTEILQETLNKIKEEIKRNIYPKNCSSPSSSSSILTFSIAAKKSS